MIGSVGKRTRRRYTVKNYGWRDDPRWVVFDSRFYKQSGFAVVQVNTTKKLAEEIAAWLNERGGRAE